jgi:hypothetical protein
MPSIFALLKQNNAVITALFCLIALSYCAQLTAADAAAEQETVVPYAPAVSLKKVEWWGPNNFGLMTWWAGVDQTPYPANLGFILEAPLVGKQEIMWLGRTFEINKVVRTDAGSFVVTFDVWKLVMGKTHEGFWLVDVFPPDNRFVTGRFRTSFKATKHADGQ